MRIYNIRETMNMGPYSSKLKMIEGMNPLVQGDHYEQRRWELGHIFFVYRGKVNNPLFM